MSKFKPKICKECGCEFIPTTGCQVFCKGEHFRPCPVCGKLVLNTRLTEPAICCSTECRKENTKRKNIQKYGTEHPMQNAEVREHHKKTMIEKYGVESPLQSEDIKQRAIQSNQARFGTDWALGNTEVREQVEATMEHRYGVKYTFQSDELMKKATETNLERYGSENVMQNEEIRQKSIDTCVERYGVSNPMQNPATLDKALQTRKQRYGAVWSESMKAKARKSWKLHLGVTNPSFSKAVIEKITATFQAKYGVKRAVHVPEFRNKMKATTQARYGVPYYVVSEEYVNNGGYIRISTANKLFAKKLEAYGIKYTFEYSLGLKSYDICIPDRKILIEIDPTYTHNAVGNHWNSNGLSKFYHRDKTVVAIEKGYRCIHVFDWDNPFDIINLLIPKFALYARNCEIKSVPKEIAGEFINNFHLQGNCRGTTAVYGLYYDNELIQIMTFGKPRYNSKYQWELLRLCTDSRYYVIGGAERLFKHFCRDYEPESIISYCDIAKFSGDVYERLGFIKQYNTEPTKVWSKHSDKITNNLLLQRGFDQLFDTNYGKGTSNEELMLQHGWLPVYDCGQSVYAWKK